MYDPILELIALLIERDATQCLTIPERIHPFREALENGNFGSREDRLRQIRQEGKEAADELFKLAEKVRRGNIKAAHNYLRRIARNDPEALELLKAIDPRAKPWYLDADSRGDPVMVGKKYRWTPDEDNQRHPAGYYCEGVVTRVKGEMAFAVWVRIGQANPNYWGGSPANSQTDPLAETWVFTTMLTPVDEEPEGDDR